MPEQDTHALVDHLFRRQAGQMVATLTRRLGAQHLALAEDAVQDALAAALQVWPYRGVPDQPEAWLFQTARNRALDRLRHARMAGDKADAIMAAGAREAAPDAEQGGALRNEPPPVADDQVALLFLCCHPDLAPDARVALSLKLVGGFSVAEIARAFLANDATIAQRLVRAKRALREGDADIAMPHPHALADRLDSVLDALYLIFNEGYASTSGESLIRDDLAREAIRLTRLVTTHPATAAPRAWALLALMLLQASRFPARVSADGSLFLLRDQDRALWDRALIAEGMRALDRSATGDAISAYHLEAAIAAAHAAAPSWEATDWPGILDLYDSLLRLTASPVVAVNRAIAMSRVRGPLAGLAALDAIADRASLSRYALLPAVEGELWREAGHVSKAAVFFREALARARSEPERRWLSARL